AVPDICTAVINLNEEELNRLVAPLKDKASVQGGRITVFGKAAHASINHQGDNAALKMLSILKEHNKDIALLFETFDKLDGSGFGISHEELTATLSVLDIYNNRLKAAIDIRYPYGVEFNEVREKLENKFKDFSVTLKNNNPLHRVSKDDPLCVSLLKAYTQETGKEGKAITIGGGTFSRAFETGVAFGCTFEDEPMCAHMADEYITEKSVRLNLKIQLAGVYELCK
ncbi:MAG: peptidase dimerization domain-containing protein, partial [Clostridia bacterium]|nr:peptidase dimerization domain-containing protein [Clostridia bacterium]